MDKRQKKRLAILDALNRSGQVLSSTRITELLIGQDVDISERSVRLYLCELDAEGLTENLGRRGRIITEKGKHEADASRVLEGVGLLSGKIDAMAYKMDFDPAVRRGTVVVNISTIPLEGFTDERRELIEKVFAKGYSMGSMLAMFPPGEKFGSYTTPEGYVGIGTVCSITLNGVLLRRGVPTTSRFGGLVELRDGAPVRFSDIIHYDGTSIDPLVVFIRSGMADYIGAVTTGNGRIGASFREFPADSSEAVRSISKQLETLGLGSLLCLGNPGQSLYGVPVGPQRVGAIIIGGLNPMSIFEETGLRVRSSALSGLVDFNNLFHYTELKNRLAALR
ncbi:NrpR regulatory domain-containing protein [Pontiellaceae bacterium B1224]|nr:NrpR regulatory domain-containing protein [Pontiellaceae bacterium B1224]